MEPGRLEIDAENAARRLLASKGGRIAFSRGGENVIDLSDTSIVDSDLELLADLRPISTLDLTNTAVGDAGLDQVAQCTSLLRLYLRGTQVSTDGIRKLTELENLFVLDLRCTKVDSSVGRYLRRMKISWLGISGTNVSARAMADLARAGIWVTEFDD